MSDSPRSPRSRSSSRTPRSPRLRSASPTASPRSAKKTAEPESSAAEAKHLTPFQVALYTALLSTLSIPTILILDGTHLVASPLFIGLVGVVVLLIVFFLTHKLVLTRLPKYARDPYISWFVLFAYTCIIDLVIAAEIDFKLDVVEWYLADGERYLLSPYGATVNWWDASAHWICYIVMVYGLCQKDYSRFRPVFLWWAGSIINSLLVLVPGGAVGSSSHNLTYSTLLNIPYILIPLWFAIKVILHMPRPHDRPATTQSSILETLFAAGFVLFAVVSTLRFAVALNSQWEYSVAWAAHWEPILNDPTNFFKVQGLVHYFYAAPLALLFVFAIFNGISHPLIRDFIYLFAGVMAQSQFTLLRCAGHWDTAPQFRADGNNVFWLLNVGLFAFPQLFAYYVWQNGGLKGVFARK